MAGFNIQSNHESYPYNIQSDQLNSMDSNYTNGFPLNQTIITDLGYANMDQPISMGYNGIHSYQHNQTPLQPPGQDSFSSDIGLFDYNGIYIGVNESLNTENYGYIRNNENVANYSTINYDLANYNPPSVHYPLSQTLVQTPPTSTPSNNAGAMANAASHRRTVTIVKADITLEELLSIIQ